MSDLRRLISSRVIGLLIATCGMAAPAVAQTAVEILTKADAVRNPGAAFASTNQLSEYRNGRLHNSARLTVYSRIESQDGQYQSVVAYAAPAQDAGKALLMRENVMWFYDPAARNSIRISPQQRLLGQAASADVVSVNLHKDYSASIAGMESVVDADGTPRDTWRLLLTAASEGAAYLRIDYWVERSTFHPVKSRFYAASERPLKVTYYRKYVQQLGGLRPSEVIIVDEIDPNLMTKMVFSNWRIVNMPDSWFRREYLPNIRAE